MGDIMIKFLKMLKNTRRNHNLYVYYFNKWAEACGELGQAQRDLDDAKMEIKELKDKVILLTQQNQSYIEETVNLRGKIINLEKQIKPFKKHRFKKGNIPWNKGKKLK